MKKSLFFVAAASALMLTACSSENDVVQNAPQTQETTAQAVGFDIYTPAATGVTRAGLTGTMTTSRMQRSEADGGGFGVYAFLTEDAIDGADATAYAPTAGQDPNFMWNEKILWNNKDLGWYYNPLKYWPNETNKDSQATPAEMEQIGTTSEKHHLDRLTFFAYAPYVSNGSGTTGIIKISDEKGDLDAADDVTDPTIKYVSTDNVADVDPNNYVDLLWGVAPSGGLSYTAVNGTTVNVKEGEPLIDMIKPNVNTSMKFLFNHALARFGINVVAAVDQVSPGGKLDPNTKITIESFKITGPFGIGGNLNLNNGINKNIANWTKMTGGAADESINGETTTLSADKSITVKTAIADNLKYAGSHTWGSYSEQTVVGVTTAKQDMLDPSTKWFTKLAAAPAYNLGKKYYTDAAGTTPAVAQYNTTKKGECYTLEEGKYVVVESGTAIDAPAYPSGATDYYTVSEVKEFEGNHLLGYSFKSYLSSEATGDPVATGKVEFVSATDTKTTVKVTENSVDGFVGNQYVVESTTFDTNTVYELKNTDGTATGIWVKLDNITYGYSEADLPSTAKVYRKRNNGTTANPIWYYENVNPTWNSSSTNKYYTLEGTKINDKTFAYAYPTTGTYYEAERNYLYVVPTNNVSKNTAAAGNEEALRTITVEIEYYITTEDSKVNGGRTQTKNVITKKVVLPSLANSKSYMLNVVLGLTSVKIEAEVDDWKVVNVQTDLPQNTDGD